MIKDTDWFPPVVLFIIIMIGLSVVIWEIAHSTVATECDKLGAFYVKDVVYKCERMPT